MAQKVSNPRFPMQRSINGMRRAARAARLLPEPDSILFSICMDGALAMSENAKVHQTTFLHLLRFLSETDLPIAVRSTISNAMYPIRTLGYYPRATLSPWPINRTPWAITVSDGSSPLPKRTRRHWEIHYDYRPSLELGSDDHVVPYGIHPAHVHNLGLKCLTERLISLRTSVRKRRLFFAGSMHSFYDRRGVIGGVFGKLSRMQILTLARATGMFFEPSDREQFRNSDESFILIDSARCGIPQAQWLSEVARSDFMLCPPGAIMPMCYNIVESMAVGTIPLTNYPEWFFPRLRHGQECFAFTDKDDLLTCLEEIRTLSASRIAAMRQACITYYDTYLDPRAVVTRILASGSDHVRLHVLDETHGHLPPGPGGRSA